MLALMMRREDPSRLFQPPMLASHMAVSSLCDFIPSSLCACLTPGPNFPFVQGHQSYWMRAHPQDLILTYDFCKDAISKEGHILKH